MPLVYFVEDDPSLRRELGRLFELEGVHWVSPQDPSRVVDDVARLSPDCVILDAMLGSLDGRVLCRQIRRQSDVPIIMLTCLDSSYDEVAALNQGADDYLTKPYHPAVLMAHVRAALRRKGAANSAVICHKGLELDISSGRVTYDGNETSLTRNESRILATLMRSPGHVISRRELICELWESDAFIDDNTLTVNVNRLRKALASIDAPEDYVITRRGIGYQV